MENTSLKKQSGQGATEFIIVAPVALLMIFSILQFSMVYQCKVAMDYAAFSAVREAAVYGGSKEAIERGFAVGFAPFFTYDDDPLAVPWAVSQVYDQIDDGLILFERINPPELAFSSFASELVEDEDTGYNALPNDNLMYRDPTEVSGLNIQDANLLKVAVLYCYPLAFPLVNTIIAELAQEGDINYGAFCNNAHSPSLPIVVSSTIRMQSDVLDDPRWRNEASFTEEK